MRLVFLGTSGYHPSESRHTACLMLPEVGVVLDAGTGLFRLPRYLEGQRLDLFLSHAHLDHVVGLTYLLGMLHARPEVRVVVHGMPEKLAAITRHLYAEELFPVAPNWEAAPLAGPVELAGGGRLTCFPLAHPGGSLGFRLDWPGHALAYVTDTHATWDAPYAEHLAGVDCLVHECNFADEHDDWAEATGHSSTSRVATLAQQAGVGRLLLVHLNPADPRDDPVGLDAARAIFPRTELASDLDEIDF